MPDSVKYIGDSAFKNAQFKDISTDIPNSLKVIGNNAFQYSFWKEESNVPVNSNISYDVLNTLRTIHAVSVSKNRKQVIKLPSSIQENSLINYELVESE